MGSQFRQPFYKFLQQIVTGSETNPQMSFPCLAKCGAWSCGYLSLLKEKSGQFDTVALRVREFHEQIEGPFWREALNPFNFVKCIQQEIPPAVCRLPACRRHIVVVHPRPQHLLPW